MKLKTYYKALVFILCRYSLTVHSLHSADDLCEGCTKVCRVHMTAALVLQKSKSKIFRIQHRSRVISPLFAAENVDP